jgi:hypothetical protein
MISRNPFINFEEALGEFPRLSGSLRNGELGSVRRGRMTATCRLERVPRKRRACGRCLGKRGRHYRRRSWAEFSPGLGACRCVGSRRIARISNGSKPAREAAAGHGAAAAVAVAGSLRAAKKTRVAGLPSDPGWFRRTLTAHVGDTSPAFLAEVTARLGGGLWPRRLFR